MTEVKNGMKRIPVWDSHVHLFPPEIYKNWDRYAQKDSWFAYLTRKGEAWADAEEAMACADEAGVEGLVMQGWYWNDPGLQQMHNDYMAECLKKYPDRLKAFISVNPKLYTDKDQMFHEIDMYRRRGFSGIGELGPGGNQYDLNDSGFIDLLEYAQQYKMPVCIHCGEPVGRDYPGRDRTSLAPIPELVKKYMDVKFILAHLGGGLPFYEMLRGYGPERFKNVYYDTAANPLIYDIRSLKTVVGIVGPDRLLYGSDFPLILYPKKSRDMNMSLFIQDIHENSGLTEEELQKVFRTNISGLL